MVVGRFSRAGRLNMATMADEQVNPVARGV